jgi:hypothetical protein
MMEILDQREAITSAWQQFHKEFAMAATWSGVRNIGYQSGSDDAIVVWHETEGIWGTFNPKPLNEDSPTRYWNAFGREDPQLHSSLSITCEINPPHEGINRRVAGAFGRDERDRLYVLHSGKIGGGRPGIGMSLFWDNWKGETFASNDKDSRRMALVTPLADADLVSRVKAFVDFIAELKAEASGNSK